MNDLNSAPALTLEISQDDRTMATLAHALRIVAWWIAPLIIYVLRRQSKFVAVHAMPALLWQIVLAVFWMVAMVLWFVVIFATVIPATGKTAPSTVPPTGIFVGFGIVWLAIMGAFLLNLVLGIVYGVKAGQGQWAAYPLIGRLARRIVGC